MNAYCRTLVISLGLTLNLSHALADPLFDRMAGCWNGVGWREQAISKKRTSIKSRVETRMVGSLLVSRSVVTERVDEYGAEPKTYRREYWIRRLPSGVYDLGQGQTVKGFGSFGGNAFYVEQRFGSQPGYLIRSETYFGEKHTSYNEVFFEKDRRLAEVYLQYTPVTALPEGQSCLPAARN